MSGLSVPPPSKPHGPERPGRVCECGAHAFAPLTQGYVALVDPQDIGLFARKWFIRISHNHVTAMRILHPQRTCQLMHRLIAGATGEDVVDHINRDPLDNRRSNLRICDQSQNMWNSRPHRDKSSGLPKGVARKRKRFAARIMARGVYHNLGVFSTPEEAGEAYALAAKRFHGEFARVAA